MIAQGHIEADLQRAIKAVRAAESLLDNGFPEDAVSRAYYAVLHAARAALMVEGLAARTHTGVRRRFGTDLVQSGSIEGEWAKVLARAQSARETADYDTATAMDEERAADLVDQARRFVARMAEFRDDKGL